MSRVAKHMGWPFDWSQKVHVGPCRCCNELAPLCIGRLNRTSSSDNVLLVAPGSSLQPDTDDSCSNAQFVGEMLTNSSSIPISLRFADNWLKQLKMLL